MTDNADYVPPESLDLGRSPSGGQFANVNRPIAGPTHDKTLPVGKHPFQLYSLATPNGQKVSIMFEELLEKGHRDAEYDAWPIRIGEGDQFSQRLRRRQPQFKNSCAASTAAAPSPCACSNAARSSLHLAEKFGEFLPPPDPDRAETLSWLFWQMGSAPFLGGGFGHFFAYAPSKMEYPINRYAMEAKRQLDVLEPPARRTANISRAPTIRSPISRSGRGTAARARQDLRRRRRLPRDARI